MKIKRYFAPDIRQAMRMVREEQGPDAVILSNRRVDGGVEIVAALDFDEQALQDKLAEQAAEAAPAAPTPAPSIPLSNIAERLCATLPSSINRRPAADTDAEKIQAPQPSQATVELLTRLRSAPTSRREPDAVKPSAPVSRASQAARPALATSRPVAPPTSVIKAATVAHTPASRPELSAPQTPAAANAANSNDSALALLQQELRALRRVVDTRLSEAGWQASSNNLNTVRVSLLRGLCERGFSKRIALHLANRLSTVEDCDLAWRQAKDILAQQLTVADDQLLEYGGIAALVGPTGVGKTTTIAKLAAKFRLKHGPRQIALITIDNYRIAAHEHLHTYGRLLDVPVAIAANGEELQRALRNFLDKKLVLIDTAGMGPYDARLEEQLSMLKQSEIAIKPYLVISAATQLHGLEKVVEMFGHCQPQGCILTKLDEAMQPAMALSVLMRHRLMLSFVADGQQVPEDLHVARATDLIGRCFPEASAFPLRGGVGSLGDADDADNGYAFEDWVVNGSL